jgi:hypothetical protein
VHRHVSVKIVERDTNDCAGRDEFVVVRPVVTGRFPIPLFVIPLRQNTLSRILKFLVKFFGKGRHGNLLKWILFEQRPANDTSQVHIGAAAKIGDKSGIAGEPQKLSLDHIGGSEIARRYDGGP